MKTLNSFTFTAVTTAKRTPVMMRRAKLVSRLEQQKALAEDPLYLRTEHKWVTQGNGVKERVEQRKRVRPWWRTDDQGNVYLTVRYGSKAMEFEKGKRAILLSGKAQLIEALDTLIAAAKGGELDDQLNNHAKARGIPKSKRAA